MLLQLPGTSPEMKTMYACFKCTHHALKAVPLSRNLPQALGKICSVSPLLKQQKVSKRRVATMIFFRFWCVSFCCVILVSLYRLIKWLETSDLDKPNSDGHG